MKLWIEKATTDVTVYVFVQDSSATDGSGLTGLVYNSAGLTASYVRPLAARAALTLATQTVTGAHSDGGFVEVDATNMPGVYRLDLSDAVCATGVDSTVVYLHGATNMAPIVLEIQLTTLDPNTAMRGTDSAALASNYTSARAGYLDNINGHTAQTGDSFARLGAPAGASVSADIGDVPTVAEFNARTLAAAAYFDPTADAVANVTLVDTTTTNTDMRGTDNALLAATWNTVMAGITSLAEWLGLLAGKQSGDATARTEIRATGAGSGTFDEAADSLEAIRDRGDAAWTTGAGTGLTALASGTAQGGAAGSITLAAGASATDDLFKHANVKITGGTGAGQARPCTGYVGATKVASVTPNWTTNPDATSVYEIVEGTADVVAIDGVAVSSGTPEVDVTKWNGTAVATPTTAGVPEVDVTHVGGVAEDIATETKQDTAQADLDLLTGADGATLATSQPNYAPATAAALATHDGKLDTVDGNVDAVLVDTGTTIPATLGTPAGASMSADIAANQTDLDAILADTAAILADTGTDGVAISTATMQSIADELLDRANGIETSWTPRQAFRIILSATAAKLSGAATATNVIRDVGDTKDRITATVDGDGNRTAITYDKA